MVKTKKRNKISISAIVLFIVSFVILATSVTLAWFTSISSAGNETLEFGTINVTATSSDLVTAVSPGTDKTTLLMPKDNLTIKYTIKNEGEAAYFISKVSITAEAEDATIQALAGTYIASGNTKSSENQVGMLEKGAAELTMTHTAQVPEDLSNDFQGKTVTIGVTVYAIQQENLTAAEAYAKIIDMIDSSSAVEIPEDGFVYIDDQNIYYTYHAEKGGYVIEVIDEFIDGEYVYIIPGGAETTATDVVVPSHIKGVPVVEVGAYAFYSEEENGVTSIVVEEGIKIIGDGAFSGCNAEVISLPNSLTYIGNYALCSHEVRSLFISKNVTWVGEGVCSETSSLETLYIDSAAMAYDQIGTSDDWFLDSSVQYIYISKELDLQQVGYTFTTYFDREPASDTEDYYAYVPKYW